MAFIRCSQPNSYLLQDRTKQNDKPTQKPSLLTLPLTITHFGTSFVLTLIQEQQHIKNLVMKTSAIQTIAKTVLGSLFIFICFASAIQGQPSFLSETDFYEPELNVEDWMIDQESFDASFEESTIEIEPWMIDESDFNHTHNEPLLAIDSWMTNVEDFDNVYSEDLLVIEDWMTAPENLDNCNNEPLLAMENWMTDLDVFFDYFQPNTKMLFAEFIEEPIKLESWMTNVDDFLAGPLHKLPNIHQINLMESAPILVALHTSSK